MLPRSLEFCTEANEPGSSKARESRFHSRLRRLDLPPTRCGAGSVEKSASFKEPVDRCSPWLPDSIRKTVRLAITGVGAFVPLRTAHDLKINWARQEIAQIYMFIWRSFVTIWK